MYCVLKLKINKQKIILGNIKPKAGYKYCMPQLPHSSGQHSVAANQTSQMNKKVLFPDYCVVRIVVFSIPLFFSLFFRKHVLIKLWVYTLGRLEKYRTLYKYLTFNEISMSWEDENIRFFPQIRRQSLQYI